MCAIMFGSNPKSQLAARTALNLAHRHGKVQLQNREYAIIASLLLELIL